MRNPLREPQQPSWREIVVAIYRGIRSDRNVWAKTRKARVRWIAGGLLGAALAAGISLVALGRERSAKRETPSAGTASSASEKGEPASAKGASRLKSAKGETSVSRESNAATPRESDKAEPAFPNPQVQASPAPSTAQTSQQDLEEGPEVLRERAEWFYRQRAYPLGHIPAGARQRAIEHRKAMEARQSLMQAGAAQQAAAAGSPGSPSGSPLTTPPITFPGPANFTPIGPQPLNPSFVTGPNFGNPSASGRIDSIALDPNDATHQTFYLAAADGGVWKTTNAGTTWAPLTDSQASLSMGAVQVSPVAGHGNIIYAATGEQNSFGFDNYFGAGVLKSTDAGSTWTQTGTPAGAPFVGPFSGSSFSNAFFGGAHISSVAINPSNDSLVLVGVQFGGKAGVDPPGTSSGVYCTDNGGSTWSQIASASTTMASFVGYASSTVAWSGIGYPQGDANNGIYVSTNADGGASKLCSAITFTQSTGTGLPAQASMGRIILGPAPSDPTGKTAYAAIANSSGGSNTLLAFVKTTDGGSTWTTQTPAATGFCNSQCWYDMAVGVDPSNANNVAVGGSAFTNNSSTIWVSTDGGTTWKDITTGATAARPHVDTHSIVFVPGTTTLFTGDDGGVWSTANYTASPVTWTGLNSTLQITQQYPGLSISRTDENKAYSGAQDNGTDAFTGSSAWTNVACGDGGFTAIDAQFDTTVYAACQNISIFKSYFDGAPGTFISSPTTGIGADRHSFISPLVQGPAPGLLYFGTFKVYQSTNNGNLWTSISPDLTTDGASFVETIAAAGSNPDIVYAGTGDGQVWRTTNATSGSGAIWTNLTKAPLPTRFITSIWVDDSDPNIAWVAFSGFSGFGDTVGHLFQTADGGATWTDISCTAANCSSPNPSDLPNTPVNEVKFASNSNTLFVGTDVGVFSSTMGSGTWSIPFAGLPHSVVLSLNASRRGDIGFVATHGRGTWIVGLPRSLPTGAFLTSISPSSANAGASGFTMTLNGANFTASSAALWDGAANGITTTFLSANQLTAMIPTALLTVSGQHSVTVSDPAGSSKQIEFNIMAPRPSLSFISPTSGSAGTGVTITATGSGFVTGTQLVFNGTLIAGTVSGGTTLTANVPASLVTASGNVFVDVFSPQPGGGNSGNSQAFNITIAAPSITSLNPSSVGAGGPGFLLTVNGSNFASNAFVTVGGTSEPVTFVNSGQLLVSVPSTKISLAGSNPAIVVFDPVASGPSLSSNSVNLTVTSTPNPVPTISSLSPSAVAAGSNFTLTVINTDSSYVGNSVVRVKGAAVATTYVDAMHLSASVPSVDVATPGPVPITVFNPAPPTGGQTSAPFNLTVTGAIPTIASLSPNSAIAGSPAGNMSVTGTNFDATAVVKWAGTGLTTSFITSTQLVAAVPATDLSTAGTFAVTVTNSSGTSNVVNFTVTGGVGSATKLAFTTQPSNVAAGASITPAVQVAIQDASGNTVTTATNSVTIGIGTNPSGGNLGGTATVAAVNGIATFSNLSINKTGTGYTLAASATTLTGATSNAFNVTPGAAAKLAFTTQPSNVAAGASITPAVQVTVQDAQGNTVTSATNSITMAIGTNPSGGTLSGTLTVAAVSGAATFSNLSIDKTGTGYTLAASATSLTGATSSAFNVTPGTATKLAFTVQPSNVGAGAPITPAVQVTIQDSLGNTVTSATNTITMAIGTNPGSGILSGTTSVAAVSGVAAFSNLSINNAGTGYTLTGSATGLTGATSSAFNVTSGTAAKLAFTAQPSNVAAGSSISPAVQVTVEDSSGNPITTATNSVTIAIGTNPSGGTLGGTVTVAAINGVATFSNLTINKAGTGYTLTASASGLTGATSSAFNVTAGVAAKLAFTVQPTNVAAGASISPAVQVTVQDTQGNTVTPATNSITMAIGTNPSSGTLAGTTTVAAVSGIATFSNLSINNGGTGYTLAVSATGLTGATSNAFNVTAGASAKLAFTVQPTNVAAGASITPSVQVSVQDAQGNTVTSATNSITIAIGTNPSGGALAGTTTVAAVSGVATFSNLNINKTGTGYTLAASATGLTGATSSAFNVTAGAAAKLAFTVQPANVAAGASISPAVQVTVQDAQGNTVTSATNSITMAIGTNPSSGTLAGTTTVAAVNGIATFSTLSINNAGAGYTLTASATGLTGATSSAFNVTAGAAAKLAFTVQPANVAAGASIVPSVQVTVQDAQGNTVISATNSITIVIGTNPGGGTLSGTTTASASGGVATFSNLSINFAGAGYTLGASADGLTSATSSAFTVSSAAAAKNVFTVQPSSAGAGSVISPPVQVTVEDAFGNTVTTATNSITIAIGTNPSAGTLSGTTTVAAVNGVATFSNLSINAAANGYTLTASATGLTSATSSTFNITSGTPAKLAFTVQPSNVGSGASITPPVQVTIEDAQGNPVTTATNSVTIAIGANPSGGTLSGTATVAAVNGVATFSNLSINNLGSGYTLTASASGLTGATSNAFNVTAGAPAKVVFTVQPSNVTAGAAIAPPVQVSIEDAGGNIVTTATNAVTIAIATNPSGGTLSGTTTVAAVNGIATFSALSINNAGTGYTLAASAASLTGATSSAFNVVAGAPAKLAFTVQPSNVASGAAITPAVQVSVEDTQGNLVSTATNSVTIAIGTNPSSGTLSGTTTVAAVNGVASFSALSIDKAGTGYALAASSVGLSGAASSLFNVTAGTATKLVFTAQPTNVASGSSISPAVQVTVQDAAGNTVTGATNSITIAIGTNPSGGTLSGTVTVAAANGMASFSNLSIDKIGVGYTLTASATGLTGATSTAFNVTAGAAAKLVFTVQPSNATAGVAIAPPIQVAIEDAGGNVVTTATNAVTIAIGTNPGTGTLSGTATVNAVSGVATFATLNINKAATGYTLTASATSLTGATSSAFNVTAGPAARVAATSGTPQNAVIGTAFTNPLVVTVTDANSNPVSGAVVTFTAPGTGASGTFAGSQNTATTNASGVATSATFTANSTAGGPYNVVASAVGATSANFSLTNNNPMPVITSLSPANTLAGGASFPLSISGTGFVTGATVDFGSDKGLTPSSVTMTQITVTIPAADIATAGTPSVVVNNPAPAVGPSAGSTFTVNNPAPTLTNATVSGQPHAAGGAAFTLTVTGTSFVSTSTVNFNGKAETTTFVSATQVTAAIPASDVATAGTFPVKVANPQPGGGTSTSVNFTVDGYTVAGPATPPSVKAGQPATIQITVTPTTNGFTNAVAFRVSGLPAHSGPPTFSPASVTPGSTPQTVTLTIPTTARGAVPPAAPVEPPTAPLLRLLPFLWLATLLSAAYAARLARRAPRLRRYAALLPLVLLLITGAALAGCVGGKQGTPAGPAQLTITATSGTLSQTTNVTLTVN